MAQQQLFDSPDPDVRKLADPIGRVATMLADVSTELSRLSDQLRAEPRTPGPEPVSRTPGTAEQPAARRNAAADRPPPVDQIAQGPDLIPGEPVDTSEAEPTQTPVAQAAGAAPYSTPSSDATRTAMSGPVPVTHAPPLPGPPRPTKPDRLARWTSREGAGTRLLAWAGGAVTLLGIVLLLVTAVQQGWIGPLGRVLGGAGLGGALIASAMWVHRKSTRGAAFALAATGIATLYLDVLAATALYGYLPAAAGLSAGLLLAGGGLWLADRWNSQALAIGVVLGCALCAPLLFGAGAFPDSHAMALLTGFLVVLKLAATPVQLRRGWPLLTVASALPAVMSALVAIGQAWTNDDPWPAAAAALAVAVTGIPLAIATAHRRPSDPVAVGLVISSATPALLAASLLGRWPALGMVATIAALYFAIWCGQKYLWPQRLPNRLGLAAGGVSALAVLQGSVVALDGAAQSLTVLGESALLAVLAVRLRGRGMLLVAATYAGVGAALAVAVDIPPTLFLRFPASPYVVGESAQYGAMTAGLLAFLLLGATSATLPWAALRLGVLTMRPEHRFPSIVLPSIGLLYSGGGVVLTAMLAAAPTETGFLAGHALVTVSWMVLAFFLLLRGIHAAPPRVAGFVLVAIALSKLVLFDLAALNGLARVGAFLGAGLVLLAGGTRYARLITERRRSAAEPG